MTDLMLADRTILVVIPTYRRTELLAPLVGVVREQIGALPARILIVDNDQSRSAESVARDLGTDYLAEPTPGIAAVRQAGLAAASPDDLVIMVDDDVLPSEGWLTALLNVWDVYQPTAVMGYVRYVWPTEADPWIVAGGFMRRTVHPTGTLLTHFVTGNVLIDARETRRLGITFDASLELSGGEDSRFGEDIIRFGGTIVASAESVCIDEVPPSRLTRGFVRTRTISHGSLLSRFSLQRESGVPLPIRRLGAFAGGAARWVIFTVQHLWGRIRNDERLDATAQRRAWFAVGRMLGAAGRTQREYARTDKTAIARESEETS